MMHRNSCILVPFDWCDTDMFNCREFQNSDDHVTVCLNLLCVCVCISCKLLLIVSLVTHRWCWSQLYFHGWFKRNSWRRYKLLELRTWRIVLSVVLQQFHIPIARCSCVTTQNVCGTRAGLISLGLSFAQNWNHMFIQT